MCKVYDIYEVDTVNNLKCFDNTSIISWVDSCQL